MPGKNNYHNLKLFSNRWNVCQSNKKICQTNKQMTAETETKTASRNPVKFKKRQIFSLAIFYPLQFFLFYQPFSATTLLPAEKNFILTWHAVQTIKCFEKHKPIRKIVEMRGRYVILDFFAVIKCLRTVRPRTQIHSSAAGDLLVMQQIAIKKFDWNVEWKVKKKSMLKTLRQCVLRKIRDLRNAAEVLQHDSSVQRDQLHLQHFLLHAFLHQHKLHAKH